MSDGCELNPTCMTCDQKNERMGSRCGNTDEGFAALMDDLKVSLRLLEEERNPMKAGEQE